MFVDVEFLFYHIFGYYERDCFIDHILFDLFLRKNMCDIILIWYMIVHNFWRLEYNMLIFSILKLLYDKNTTR